MRANIVALLLGLVLFTAPVWAAKIHLKDGTVVSGKVEKVDSEKVELVTPLGILMTIPMQSVSSIEYEPGEAPPVLVAKIHLKDGSTISGKIEKGDSEKVEVVTAVGVRMTIPMEIISSIEYEPGEIITPKPPRPEKAVEGPRQLSQESSSEVFSSLHALVGEEVIIRPKDGDDIPAILKGVSETERKIAYKAVRRFFGKTTLGSKQILGLEEVSYIETGEGQKLSMEDIHKAMKEGRESFAKLKPSLARRSIQYRMVGDGVSLGAGIARIYALNSAGDAVAAAEESSRSGYWGNYEEVERHVQDAEGMTKLNNYLVIGAMVWWLGVGLAESKEEEENFKRFTVEKASGVRIFKLIGEVADISGSILCWYYSYKANSELQLDNYSRAEEFYKTATTWAVVSAAGAFSEVFADFLYLEAAAQPESWKDRGNLSLNTRFREGSPFVVLSYSF